MNEKDVVRKRKAMKRNIILWGVATGVVLSLLSALALICKLRGHETAVTSLSIAFVIGMLFSFLFLIRIERNNSIECPACRSHLSSDFQFAMLLATKKCYYCSEVIVTEIERVAIHSKTQHLRARRMRQGLSSSSPNQSTPPKS